VPSKQIFIDWQESAREMYDPVVKDRPANLGTPIVGTKRGQRNMLNVGPALSPDGRMLAFLSTRAILDVDLFLADAKTGKVIRRLSSSGLDPHFDDLRFIDSAGAWSPDETKLAVVVFEKGDNYLALIDVNNGHLTTIRVPGVDSINNVAWSPDGHSIAMSAQANNSAFSDLFIYDLGTNQVRRLTSDKYADLQPAWSPDGKTIAFVTDRGEGSNLEELRFRGMRIATIDANGGTPKVLPLFPNAKNINPQFSPDGSGIYFIGNPEGVADVYKYNFADGRVGRVTHVQTGVAGITEMSPALSVASREGTIAVSLYEEDNYNLYELPPSTPAVTMASLELPPDSARGGQLPPLRGTGSTITDYLANPVAGLPPATVAYRTVPSSSCLHLAYVGPPSIGVATGSFGTGVGGSVAAEFTDVLGEHNVGFTLQGGGTQGVGTFADQVAGDVFYLNQKHRWNWGVEVSHLPYISAFVTSGTGVVNGQPVDIIQQEVDIQRYDAVSGVLQYPFSQSRRVEL